MRQSTRYRAISELTSIIENWLENIEYNDELPHLPADISHLMATQCLSVLEILKLGEQSLLDDGMLKED